MPSTLSKLLLYTAPIFVPGVGCARADSRPVVVATAAGQVRGVGDEAVIAFKGIPYAAPPVGALRWRPTALPTPWRDVRDASDYGPSCPQARSPANVSWTSKAATTDEDCLYLNVWRPVASASARPVLVWIHGGGNQDGTASQTYYDGSSFARDGLVFVSFNYRLGPLGFFAHPALAGPDGREAANFGLTDQLAALRWVRDNIARFGGDPRNVTVMGESAGGEDILDVLASGAGKGLFARAIVESAGIGWRPPAAIGEARAAGQRLAARAGAGDNATAATLRALPADALIRAVGDEGDAIGPALDGQTLDMAALDAFARSRATAVPLLIGTNDGEGSSMGPLSPPADLFPKLTAADLAALRELYGSAAGDDRALSALLMRDAFFAAPARRIALANAPRAPTYLYRFQYVSTLLRERRANATHGSEIPFVFETGRPSSAAEADVRMAATIHRCWVSFATGGAPDCGIPWPRYAATTGQAMIFADTPHAGAVPDAAALDLLTARLGG